MQDSSEEPAIELGPDEGSRALLPLVYDELHRQARLMMGGERAGHTLQPTALVHEAWLRLASGEGAALGEEPLDRARFFRLAARCMRNVLVDHARARGRDKRGGGRLMLSLDGVAALFEERELDVLTIDEAVAELAAVDPQLARTVELRFFGGLTIAETAEAMGVSTPTVERAWRVARAWLRERLDGA